MDELNLESSPYGTSVLQLFNKSQSMTGFGNMLATLTDLKILNKISDLDNRIENIKADTATDGFYELIKCLDKVRGMAKKIGNDQRLYFYQFFKRLFDRNEECYLDIYGSAKEAFRGYERIVS